MLAFKAKVARGPKWKLKVAWGNDLRLKNRKHSIGCKHRDRVALATRQGPNQCASRTGSHGLLQRILI